jgi:hypothetical protein
MIANPCFHSWRDPQRLMNPAEIVMHVMERDRVLQILKLFGKAVGQSRKPAHRHSLMSKRFGSRGFTDSTQEKLLSRVFSFWLKKSRK